MLLSLVIFSVVGTVSSVCIRKSKAIRKEVSEKNEKLQLMSKHLHTYINAERNYDEIKSKLAVKNHFFQQLPATARQSHTEEILQMQAELKAQKTAYINAKTNYLNMGKQIY